MAQYKLIVFPEADFHMVYDDETCSFRKMPGKLHWKDARGGFSQLSKDDFHGVFRRDDDTRVHYWGEHIYPDDPARFLIWVDFLGPKQARVHYALDGKVVETAVYDRAQYLGVTCYDAFEEDLDNFLYFSKEHEPRRALWPDLFPPTQQRT